MSATQMVWSPVVWFCRWSVGIAFAAAALGKLRDMSAFRQAIDDFRVLPAARTGAAAVASVAAECAVVVLLAIGGVGTIAGLGSALVLLTGFSVLLIVALRRDARVSCNCFGASPRRISWYDVTRNGVLALCCAAGLWGAARGPAALPEAGVAVVLGLMAATVTAVVTHLEDVVETLRRPLVIDG